MLKFKKTVVVIVAAGMLAGSFVAFQTKDAQAISYEIKEFIIKPLVRKIANSFANKIANRVYDKVSGKTDNHEPFFVLSWRNLLLESEGRGTDVFRSMIKGTDFCSRFKDTLIQNFGADFANAISGNSVADDTDSGFRTFLGVPGQTSFDFLNKCTFNYDADEFSQDFTKGGWEAFLELVQPQNNYFGAFANSIGEKNKQEKLEEKAAVSQAVAGEGFLPNRKDTTKGRAGGPRGCVIGGANRCTIFGRTLAPEKLFGEAAVGTINTKIGSYYNAQELTDVVAALFDAIVKGVLGRLTDFSGFDVAQFAEQQFESDRSEGTQHQQSLRACLAGCGSASSCDSIALPPSEQQTCRQNLATCQSRCYLDSP